MSERRDLAAEGTESPAERNPGRDAALAEFNALRAEITVPVSQAHSMSSLLISSSCSVNRYVISRGLPGKFPVSLVTTTY
jgi:hypothetical protein